MTVHLERYRLTYVSVPKSACTSLKRFFFEIENGTPFRAFRLNGKAYGIHHFARSIPFERLKARPVADHARIAVVRDPVSRVVSCYANKVAALGQLERPEMMRRLQREGLDPRPDLEAFVDCFEDYCAASPGVRHHVRPLSHFLGHDPGYFDRLFPMADLPELVRYVGDRVGQVPALTHNLRSGSRSLLDDLSAPARARLERLFAEDLEIFGAWM